MNTDNFEERIKGAFERHHPETDTDAIWENIEPRLKKKKKRRFIIFFFWGLGLGLLLLLFRYGAVRHNPEQQADSTPAGLPAPASAPAVAPLSVHQEPTDRPAATAADVLADQTAAAATAVAKEGTNQAAIFSPLTPGRSTKPVAPAAPAPKGADTPEI